jgi:hypothetical protein
MGKVRVIAGSQFWGKADAGGGHSQQGNGTEVTEKPEDAE